MSPAAPPFRLFVIYHKILHEGCYDTVSGEELSKYVRFLGVNGAIQKQVPDSLLTLTIQERDLPWYNPFLQVNRFCETSAFTHVLRNAPLLLRESGAEIPYVGFCHYDMILRREAVEFLDREIRAAEAEGRQMFFPHAALVARPHLGQLLSWQQWSELVTIYNAMFRSQRSIWDVVDKEIPLYHTYVMRRDLFQRMMLYAEFAIPRMFEMLNYETRHLPYQIERLHGIFLRLQELDGQTGEWKVIPGLIHQEHLKDAWQAQSPVA
jgi:hypothetical protein